MSDDWKRRAGSQDPDEEFLGMTLRDAAAKAERALQEHLEEDIEQATVDLLTNLMHLADREGEDFEAMLETARTHYRAEVDGRL